MLIFFSNALIDYRSLGLMHNMFPSTKQASYQLFIKILNFTTNYILPDPDDLPWKPSQSETPSGRLFYQGDNTAYPRLTFSIGQGDYVADTWPLHR